MIDPEIDTIKRHIALKTAEHAEFSQFWNEAMNERQISRAQLLNPHILNAAETLAWVVYLKVKRGQQ